MLYIGIIAAVIGAWAILRIIGNHREREVMVLKVNFENQRRAQLAAAPPPNRKAA